MLIQGLGISFLQLNQLQSSLHTEMCVMYNTHPLTAFCRCQFVSCNKNTLHEMTGLHPAGCTQTGYNTSLVSCFVLYYLCFVEFFS